MVYVLFWLILAQTKDDLCFVGVSFVQTKDGLGFVGVSFVQTKDV
jgi:hypothetical protein